MAKKNDSTKVVFSERIDSKISGLALGFSFIVAGILLAFFPSYFGDNNNVTLWIRLIFIIFGTLGLIVEMKKESEVKGYDDLSAGIFLVFICLCLFLLFDNIVLRVITYLLFIIGVYAVFSGVLKISYSIWQFSRQKNKGLSGTVASEVVAFLTKVASLALIVVQILKVCIEFRFY